MVHQAMGCKPIDPIVPIEYIIINTGLMIASSNISGLLVAPMKNTLFFDETPSISVSS